MNPIKELLKPKKVIGMELMCKGGCLDVDGELLDPFTFYHVHTRNDDGMIIIQRINRTS